jgi:transposase-like protein
MSSPKERKEIAERAVRQRQKWIATYHEIGDAGAVCRRFGVSRPTLRKWLRRFDVHGEAGLNEQSRRPISSPAKKVSADVEQWILSLRRERRRGVKRGGAAAPAWRAPVPGGDPQGLGSA